MDRNIVKIPLADAVKAVAWYEKKKDLCNFFSIKTRWALAQNVNQMKGVVKPFECFCNELKIDLQKKYFTDEKYYDKIDNELKIKDEYMPKFKEDVNDINSRITELLKDDIELSLIHIDLNGEFENMDETPSFTMDDMEILLDLGNDIDL